MTSDPIARYLNQRTAKMDRRNRLRIMTGSEVIDVAIRVYQVMGWTFLKLTIVPSLFCLAAFAFFGSYVLPAFFVTQHAGSESGQLIEFVTNIGLTLFVAAPLFILGVSYTSVVVTQMVSDYMVGNTPQPEAAAEKGRNLLTKLFWLNLRETVLASGGFLGSILLLALAGHLGNSTAETDATAAWVLILAWIGFFAGIIFFLVVITKHALAPAVLTLEDTGVGDSVKRSIKLLKNYGIHGSGGGAVWGVYLLLAFLWLLVGAGVSASLEIVGLNQIVTAALSNLPYSTFFVQGFGLVPSFLVIWTLVPVWAATTTIIYYDRRIRLEGYDIEALAEDVWRADRSRRFEL